MASSPTPAGPREIALEVSRGSQGRVQLVALCRRMAIEEGDSLECMIWRTVRALSEQAERGDPKAIDLMLRLFVRPETDEQPKLRQLDGKDAEVAGYPRALDYVAEVDRVLSALLPADQQARLDRMLA